MSLNPLRDALGQSGLRAHHAGSSFKVEADGALAGFQAIRSDLERQVRRGDLTLKVAREQAAHAAAALRDALLKSCEAHSPVPRAFLDRLVEAGLAREKAREAPSIEGLQRETNRLLRQALIEQQLQSRSVEFEGQTFHRPIVGGPAAPTLDRLLAFHESAALAGDEAASEWARRQLEGQRNRTFNDDDRRRIDRACDRPDRLNPRVVAAYVEAMEGRSAEELETFVATAREGRDANACVAAFVLARQGTDGTSVRWARAVLEGLKDFPDVALTSLRVWEADARRVEAEAAHAQADYAVALAEAEARFPELDAPDVAAVRRDARVQAKPVARLGEPVGLGLDRRGMTSDEFVALAANVDADLDVSNE